MTEIQMCPETVESRPGGSRIFKQLRQRARGRFEVDGKPQSAPQTGFGRRTMEGGCGGSIEKEVQDPQDHHDERSTLCLPNFTKSSIVHRGDDGFKEVLQQYFPSAESNATERLVDMKKRLKNASTYDFWTILMEGISDITDSQCCFVAKRMLVDDQDSAVEMPELGDPGSCLMGIAFYINNGSDVKQLNREYRYHAYGTPCAHMKHDKVFIIPERMSEIITDNPNKVPWEESDAFIGLPLFEDGKCFAHFGMVWSKEGSSRRKLGWNYIEMFMHSLEDMILQRIIEGKGFVKDVTSQNARVIPLSAISASQSLKPYARNLSHELRTPMQGVVGMLDVMHHAVLEAISDQPNEQVRSVFETLRSNIEVVQKSSVRAIEAADNVVHAYDNNFELPSISNSSSGTDSPDQDKELSPSKKRALAEDDSPQNGPPLKKMFCITEIELANIYSPKKPITSDAAATQLTATNDLQMEPTSTEMPHCARSSQTLHSDHRVSTLNCFRRLLANSLRRCHPINQVHTDTELGERIELTTEGPRGELQDISVTLEVEPQVPSIIVIQEQQLQFSLHKLIDNSIKFMQGGSVTLKVRIGTNSEGMGLSVIDTGCGIAEEFQQEIFKPHFQQDSSMTRSRDGLGLSLFNAKSQVRKSLGGDLTLVRSEIEGSDRGSEFLIRLPMSSDGSTDAPIVGTPPPSSHQGRSSYWSDVVVSPTRASNSDSMFRTSPQGQENVSRVFQSSPSRRTATKRPSGHPNLADRYPLNILIAEDNPVNQQVAVAMLKRLGYKECVAKAMDGSQAIQRFKESLSGPPEKRFDLVLMDLWMPIIDGVQASKTIISLANSVGHSTTVVAVTADILRANSPEVRNAGMLESLPKPFRALQMEQLISKLFSEREAES